MEVTSVLSLSAFRFIAGWMKIFGYLRGVDKSGSVLYNIAYSEAPTSMTYFERESNSFGGTLFVDDLRSPQGIGNPSDLEM